MCCFIQVCRGAAQHGWGTDAEIKEVGEHEVRVLRAITESILGRTAVRSPHHALCRLCKVYFTSFRAPRGQGQDLFPVSTASCIVFGMYWLDQYIAVEWKGHSVKR